MTSRNFIEYMIMQSAHTMGMDQGRIGYTMKGEEIDEVSCMNLSFEVDEKAFCKIVTPMPEGLSVVETVTFSLSIREDIYDEAVIFLGSYGMASMLRAHFDTGRVFMYKTAIKVSDDDDGPDLDLSNLPVN